VTNRKRGAAGIIVSFLSLAVSARAQTVTLMDSVNQSIPDFTCSENSGPGATGAGGLSRAILVNSAGVISDVNVLFRAIHTWRADLQAGLAYHLFGGPTIGPIGLLNNHGTSADHYYATLDSAAGTTCADTCDTASVTCSSLPGATCRPDSSLDAFNGLPARGEFILTVCDKEVNDFGTLVEWSLVVTGMSAERDVDANGVVNALTDGLLTLRYEFGFRGATLTNNAVAGNCTRCTPAQIEAFLSLELGD
jgi:hypothetical protein